MSTQKYYAVKLGRQPGVYLSFDAARQEGVADHPNALWRSFRSMDDAVKYVRDGLPHQVINNEGEDQLVSAHSANLSPLPLSSLSAPPLSAPPPYSANSPETNQDDETRQLLRFVEANRMTHAESIPSGREGEYQQDSILSSYYRPANGEDDTADSMAYTDHTSGYATSEEDHSTTATENPFPDQEEDYNTIEEGPEPNSDFPELEPTPLFLGARGVSHTYYVFRLRGAPKDHEVDMPAVFAIVGQPATNYMICHYFTRGSMHIVAASYQQHHDDLGAFSAALKPRGLACRPINFLWWLITSQTDRRWRVEIPEEAEDCNGEGDSVIEDGDWEDQS
ncbi:hypothetical protein FRC00_002728 [Tulasnella sp. 408]|nr:hypothetical protein FRC00_002728 [Tulasnella sp. 408]